MQTALQRQQFDYSWVAPKRRTALYQGVFAPSHRRKGATSTHRHCIKDGVFIDPPYNTGNDFVYADDFVEDAGEFLSRDGQYDEDGNRMVKNLDSNGRFHTDWLNMIYPRLRVAKDLLTDDGVIFISIDDGEIRNIRNACDEIFGESNFVACIVWQRIHSTKNDAKYFSENDEYIVCYAKSIDNVKVGLLPRTSEMNERYRNPDNDSRGAWQSGDLVASGERSNGHFIVTSPV